MDIMTEFDFKLINSTYDTEDAKRVLLSLITDKIRSIQATIFSETERFGSDVSHLRSRIEELKQERENLIVLFNKYMKEDHVVEID